MAQSPKTSQGGASLSIKMRLPSMKTVQPTRSQTSSSTVEVEAVTHTLRWIASRSDSWIAHAILLTDSISLLEKVKSGLGSPDWNMSMVDIHLRKLLWVYCPGRTCRSKGNDYTDKLGGKATLTSGLLLGRSEVPRSLRHYLREQS